MENKPVVMVLGLVHTANPGRDLVNKSRSPRPTAGASSTWFPRSEPEGSFTKGTGPLAPTLLTTSHVHSALTTCAAFPRDRPALYGTPAFCCTGAW